jgi:ribosomal protein L40E
VLHAVTRRPQERALLVAAWETTARPNGYLSLPVGDVEATAHGFTLRAHVSKQGHGLTRLRPLYLAAFWDAHPYRAQPNHALFYRESTCGFGEPLGPEGANKMLRLYDRLSGVQKNGSLYWLRHGGYTHKVLQGMKDELAGADMGWAAGSGQRQRYTHLTDRDVLQERLRLAGRRFEQEVQPQLRARICPYCNQENGPTAAHCRQCGQTLSIQDVLRELADLKANQQAVIERTLREIMVRRNLG